MRALTRAGVPGGRRLRRGHARAPSSPSRRARPPRPGSRRAARRCRHHPVSGHPSGGALADARGPRARHRLRRARPVRAAAPAAGARRRPRPVHRRSRALAGSPGAGGRAGRRRRPAGRRAGHVARGPRATRGRRPRLRRHRLDACPCCRGRCARRAGGARRGGGRLASLRIRRGPRGVVAYHGCVGIARRPARGRPAGSARSHSLGGRDDTAGARRPRPTSGCGRQTSTAASCSSPSGDHSPKMRPKMLFFSVRRT